MIRHPLPKITDHSSHHLFAQRDVIRVNPENLLPTFAAGELQTFVYVYECFIDLSVDSRAPFAGGEIYSAYEMLSE
jgi:hypothetical protein